MEKRLCVHKFGGTSLGSAERIVGAARLLRKAAASGPVVVVASAMGGVTDVLLTAAREAERGRSRKALAAVEALRARHAETAAGLSRLCGSEVTFDPSPLAELETALAGVAMLRERTLRVTDLISSFGERLSAPLVAGALRALGIPSRAVDARMMLVTDERHGDARCDRKKSYPRVRRVLLPLVRSGVLPVVTGFLARSPRGETTTLGRSGSDTTAALVGAALSAREVVIWTDVDGVMSADPRAVPGAHVLRRLSYREAAEMTYFGAKVLHFPAVFPAIGGGIPLVIRNSFRPAAKGTVISATGSPRKGIRAVTSIAGMCVISLDGRGMTGIPGIAARVFTTTARLGVSVVMFSQASSEKNIALLVTEADRPRTVAGLEQEFRYERLTGAIDRVSARSPVAVVAAVGDGMRGTRGVAAKVFDAVARAGVNVEVIAQGSSECNISFVVDEGDRVTAVRALHTVVGAA